MRIYLSFSLFLSLITYFFISLFTYIFIHSFIYSFIYFSLDASEGPTAATDKDSVRLLSSSTTSLAQRSPNTRTSVNDTMAFKRDKDKDKDKVKDRDKVKEKSNMIPKGRKTGTTTLSTTSTASASASLSTSTLKIDEQYGEDHSLFEFLKGASPAQQMQVKMIGQVFADMDTDKDGLLSPADVRTYFRSIGRNASDVIVKKWINSRDIDQDGTVSLKEFVASYSLQLDPKSVTHSDSNSYGNSNSDVETIISPVTSAFGALCLGNTPSEVVEACMAAEDFIRRILDKPSMQEYWRISVNDEEYNRRIGRLYGGTKLMIALGFEPEQNGTVIAVRDPTGRVWDSLPLEVRVMLSNRLSELKNHEQAHTEPSVSNVAAGKTLNIMI